MRTPFTSPASRVRSPASRVRGLAALAPFAVLLGLPAGALAQGFELTKEFKLDPWIPLHLGPIDMSINKGVFFLVVSAAATCATMIFLANRMQAKPNRVQTAVEAAYDLTNNTMTRSNIQKPSKAVLWFPFVATLFFFIWFNNMIGFLPLPTSVSHTIHLGPIELPTIALYAATANLSVPLILTVVVWLAYNIEGVRDKGLFGYLKSWLPEGIGGVTAIFVWPIEALSQLVRLVSLSARLFANMLAGHLLILLMGGGLALIVAAELVGFLTLPVAVIFYIFEVVLIASLQAFIFAILSAIYLGEATAEEH